MEAVRRSRNPTRTREAILDAAESLFAERGYNATSLQAVGAAAGLSRGTPGYFFGSKEGLYRAVFDRAFEKVDETLTDAYERAAEQPDALGAMRTVVSAYMSFPPHVIRLVEREAVRGGRVLEDLEPRLEQLRSTLARLSSMTETHLKPAPPPLILISIVALTWFPFAYGDTMLRALGLDASDPVFLERYRDFVSELLLSGLRRGAGPTPA
jgi:AcrR family transcriptional regulator